MMTIDEMIEVLKAAKEGKQIQATDGPEGWYDLLSPSWNFSNYSYRVKPAKKLRPWKPDEVPVGAQFRFKDQPVFRMLITSVYEKSVYCGLYCNNFAVILEIGEHSLDHGKTWLPCGVEE